MKKLTKWGKEHLPDWYPLDIYSQDLSIEEWMVQIFNRLFLKELVESKSADDDFREAFDDLLVAGNTEIFFEIGKQWIFNPNKEIIRTMTLADAFGVVKGYIPPGADLESIVPPSKGIFMNRNGQTGLLIDCFCDDKTLINEFKEWLLTNRKKKTGAVTQRELASWKEYGILNLFDLTLWVSANGAKYTDSTMANAIWPSEVGVGIVDRLRRVTRKKMQKAISAQMLRRLRRQLDETSPFVQKWNEK